jgi:hypothetical protein
MSGSAPYDDLPATIEAAFSGRTMLSAKELAAVLEMDPKTLRKHIENGDIAGRFKGTGRIRRHRVFTIADVAKFFRRPPEPGGKTYRWAEPSPMLSGATTNVSVRKRRR